MINQNNNRFAVCQITRFCKITLYISFALTTSRNYFPRIQKRICNIYRRR